MFLSKREAFIECQLNPWSTELKKIIFQPLEVVSRYRDQQRQVTEILCYL